MSFDTDYGNYIKITNENIEILYAHCKTIYLKEGENVTQGQTVGEVGTTGKSTGPHLHFEIKLEGRHIDPEMILDF